MNEPELQFPARLQKEHRAWSLHNFGDGPSHQPLLGAIEELGEIEIALSDGEEDDVRDGLADCVIFMCDYAGKSGFAFEKIWVVDTNPYEAVGLFTATMRSVFVQLARVCHHQLKLEQNIRGTPEQHRNAIEMHLRIALHQLDFAAATRGYRLRELVEKTWAKVKLRDFKKDALTGGEQKGNA